MNERPSADTGIPRPLRRGFATSLEQLDDDFVTMGLHVAEALPALTAGFLRGDQAIIEQARQLSVEAGRHREAIEDDGFVLLARESPVSRDLRRLVAILRLVSDVDRSASLLKHVTMTLERFDPRYLPDDLRIRVQELADRATAVFLSGLDAWRAADALAVTEVDAADEHVDALQEQLVAMASESDLHEEVLVLGLIARYYERIADHGVAIAQDAAFVATGSRVRVGKARALDPDGSEDDA